MFYQINESTLITEEGERFKTYGVSYDAVVIRDVSINKSKVLSLINKCNTYKLSPVHIYDIIDDFLVDFEI